MPQEWHDIGDPGFFKVTKPINKPASKNYVTDKMAGGNAFGADATATSGNVGAGGAGASNPFGTDQSVPSKPGTNAPKEVKLSAPEFVKDDKDFAFKEKCRVRVKVDYLKETINKKVDFSLFTEYKGEVQDMQHTVSGFETKGSAEAQLTLHYNDKFYVAYAADPTVKVNYFFKAAHSTGNEVESPKLLMPRPGGAAKRVRMVGMLFDANKCFLLPQALPGIKTIIEMHNANEKAEVLIVGHAEGDEELAGVDMALARADMLAAYITSKPDPWIEWFGSGKAEKSRFGTREVQLMLSALPEGGEPYYKGNASGITGENTVKAIKAFQEYYNKEKGGTLGTEGTADAETCKALVKEYMNIEDTTLGQDIVPVSHGCEGHFDDSITKDGLVADDRRLEVFFFEKGIDPKPDGKTSTPDSSHYKEWLALLTETKDFEHHGLHVLVVDADKKPVPDAKVTWEGPTKGEANADSHGFVTMVDLKAGEYTVHGEKEGFTIGDSKITYPTAKTVEVENATKTSENGIQFIMQHEGFNAKPYNDSSNNATIGYGTLLHTGAVTENDKKKYANGISKEDARKLLENALPDFEKKLKAAVKVPLNQNQFDALMSWTYNIGPGKLIESDNKWLRELNSKNYDNVPKELLRWNKETKNGVKQESVGLTKRRQDEGDLFMGKSK